MNKKLIKFFGLALLFICSVAQAKFADDEAAIAALMDMDMEQLGEVEMKLDDTFDIFDGLIVAKKTSIATGTKQFADFAPSVTSVITAQDIEVTGARTIEEVLQSVPGFQVSYSFINVPIYSIRGVSSVFNPEVLFLVNGIRVNDIFSGGKALFWSGFPVSSIARIEIIRGPGSAVYGADAFAGVINIITKTANNINGTEAGVRLGNFNTQDAWVIHGSEWNGLNIATMLDFSKTDGHQRIVESDAQTVFDQMFNTSASLAPGEYGSELITYDARLDISKQHWQFRAGFHKGDSMGVGVGRAQTLDPTKPLNEERINTDLTYHNPTVTENWDVTAQLSYFHSSFLANYQLFPPGAFGGAYPIGYLGYPSESEEQTQLSLSGIYKGFKDHKVRLGIGYANYDMYKIGDKRNFGVSPFTGQEISPTELLDVTDTIAAYMPEVSRNDWYGFIQDTWAINQQWELTAGMRYDNYSDFGSTTNPRLGLVWETTPNLITKLLYGQAFRAPAFQELHNQNNPVSRGNPNLDPETIETWEIAFNYIATANVHLTLNLFQYKAKDKIVLIPLNNTESGYGNAASWKGQGGEFEIRWKTSTKSSLLFNYSFQDSKDETTGATLTNASQQTAFLRGDYLLGSKWYIDTQVNWNDGWARNANDLRPALDGYTTVDLIMRHKNNRTSNINLAVGIRNIFDEDIRYPSPGPDTSGILNLPNDLPGAGRSYFMELRYKFD